MFWQIFVYLAILHSVVIHATEEQHGITCITSEEKAKSFSIQLRNEILTSISAHTQAQWNTTSPNRNILFFPVIDTIKKNILSIMLYHHTASSTKYGKNDFLEPPFPLACFLDELQKSKNVQLKLINAVFYDQKKKNDVNEEYLKNLKKYFHSELHEMPVNSINSSLIKWMSENTIGRKPETENLLSAVKHYAHTYAMHFSGCWDRPKSVDDSLIINIGQRRRRRFIKLPTLNFENMTQLEVESLNSKDRIGYHNNTALQYEAIRLPFKNGEFAMTIVLPYENKSLDSFVNFTKEQYLEILEQVNKNYENIDFAIPIMELPMITVHQNGTSVNVRDPIDCSFQTAYASNHTDYKPFKVNRPFGMFIYDEKTKFVLFQAWILDPTDIKYVPRKYKPGEFMKYSSERLDSNHIS